MSEPLTLIVGVLTAATLLLGLIGLAVRYALLPWLREHLVEPVEHVKKQVTENHHANAMPTLPDRIDDVAQQVFDASLQVSALARMFDGHLESAAAESSAMWSALDRIATLIPDRKDNDPNT